jgi:hypothetical protein
MRRWTVNARVAYLSLDLIAQDKSVDEWSGRRDVHTARSPVPMKVFDLTEPNLSRSPVIPLPSNVHNRINIFICHNFLSSLD